MTGAYRYPMATGRSGTSRLLLLDRVYGPGTRRMLQVAGLGPGMRVADLGCGIGAVTEWIAERVGSTGEVIGIDLSRELLQIAREHAAAAGLANVRYVQASVVDTGLPRGAFDLVVCRTVLKHLDCPEDAVREMHEVLRPGGTLACEEAVLETSACDPPSEHHLRLQDISWKMFAATGADWQVARRLYRIVLAQGFTSPQIAYFQPVFVHGEGKKFEYLSFRELCGRIVEYGIASADEVARVAEGVGRLVEDDTVVYSMSRMTQVWAVK